MYISEWTYNNQQASNIRVTTKVAVHSLLSDQSILQEYGAAIVHNLACKEVKTVVCISFIKHPVALGSACCVALFVFASISTII